MDEQTTELLRRLERVERPRGSALDHALCDASNLILEQDAALSAGQADARRYRWLVENRTTYRTGDFMNPPLCKVEFYHHAAGVIGPGPTLDAAIDAAIAASGEPQWMS